MSREGKACLNNYIDLLEDCILYGNLADGAFFKREADDVSFRSHVPFPNMNGVVGFYRDSQMITKKLERYLSDTFNQEDKLLTWVWPYSDKIPDEVISVLNKYGFHSIGEHTLVAMKPEHIQIKNFSLPENQKITQVKSEAELHSFMSITKEVFGLSEEQLAKLEGLYAAYKKVDSLKLFLGLIDDIPVTVLQSYEKNNVLGLYNGATLLGSRKTHLFTKLVQHALGQSGQVETVVAQLMPSKEAMGVLDFFGCDEVGTFHPYCLMR